MELIKLAPDVKVIAERWRQQYCSKGLGWQRTISGDSEEVYRRLCALPSDAPAEKIDQIIGNASWTSVVCSSCQRRVHRVVQFDAEATGNVLCEPCVQEAVRLLADPRRCTCHDHTQQLYGGPSPKPCPVHIIPGELSFDTSFRSALAKAEFLAFLQEQDRVRLRDEFARAAMYGLVVGYTGFADTKWQRIASEAYAAADAMLAERDKPAGVAVKDVHDSQTHGGLL